MLFSAKKEGETSAPAVPELFSGHPFLCLFAVTLLLLLTVDQTREGWLSGELWTLIVGGVGLAALLGFLYWSRLRQPLILVGDKPDHTDDWILILFVMGFLLRLYYVLYTPVNVRQHDVFSFGTAEPITELARQRHAEYIEYIYRYLRLPEVDPTLSGLSQLYHPPLHHILAALWMRLGHLLGFAYGRITESIQLLTFFYSSCGMVLCYKLFKMLKLKRMALLLPMALICFHPTFVLLSGSVNNDCLSIVLGLAALVCVLKWQEAPSVRTIVPVTLTVGGSMMAKLSGGLLAPGIAVVFLWRFFKDFREDKGCWKRYAGQFAVFAVICVPLGLGWQLRNLMWYGTPLTYVPAMSSKSSQYVGNYPLLQRLFGLPGESLTRVFEAWKESYGSSYNEYSIPLALLKTAVFGEYALFYSGSALTTVQSAGLFSANMLFYTQVALVLLSLAAMFVCLWKRRWVLNGPTTVLVVLTWAVPLGSFVGFCLKYAQTCTQDFRYLAPTMVVGAVFIGRLYTELEGRQTLPALAVKTITITLVALFALSSAMVYILLGSV